MAKNICCNYTPDEMNEISEAAAKYGMTPTGFQKYATLLLARQPVTDEQKRGKTDTAEFISQMIHTIEQKAPGETFVASAVFPPDIWEQLKRNQRLTIAHALAQYAKTHPDIVRFTGRYSFNTKVYERVDASVSDKEVRQAASRSPERPLISNWYRV